MIFTNIIIRSDITLYTADVGIDDIIISVAQQRKPKSSPVRNSHRFSQTSSQLQSFYVLDSQRTAVKTSKLAPPKNFYLVMIFTNIIIRSDITLYTEEVQCRHRCYNYKHRTTTKTKVFAREKFSQIFTDVITITAIAKHFLKLSFKMPLHNFS